MSTYQFTSAGGFVMLKNTNNGTLWCAIVRRSGKELEQVKQWHLDR